MGLGHVKVFAHVERMLPMIGYGSGPSGSIFICLIDVLEDFFSSECVLRMRIDERREAEVREVKIHTLLITQKNKQIKKLIQFHSFRIMLWCPENSKSQ